MPVVALQKLIACGITFTTKAKDPSSTNLSLTRFNSCSQFIVTKARRILKKQRYDAYLIKSVIATYKQPSTLFDSINSRMVQASHELLTSLQVRSVAYLKHNHTTGIAIPLNSAPKNLGAEVEGEAGDEEEEAVDEAEDTAAEEVIKSTPATARTGMTFHLSNDRSS
jgi:hypothetical protein